MFGWKFLKIVFFFVDLVKVVFSTTPKKGKIGKNFRFSFFVYKNYTLACISRPLFLNFSWLFFLVIAIDIRSLPVKFERIQFTFRCRSSDFYYGPLSNFVTFYAIPLILHKIFSSSVWARCARSREVISV